MGTVGGNVVEVDVVDLHAPGEGTTRRRVGRRVVVAGFGAGLVGVLVRVLGRHVLALAVVLAVWLTRGCGSGDPAEPEDHHRDQRKEQQPTPHGTPPIFCKGAKTAPCPLVTEGT